MTIYAKLILACGEASRFDRSQANLVISLEVADKATCGDAAPGGVLVEKSKTN